MAIKAFVGISRSGKTYEVCTQSILSALRQGRRVLSNIAGLNQEAFNTILFGEGLTEDKIGRIVQVEHEQVLEANFFRTDLDDKKGLDTFIQPGDLLALDEIWRFWKKRGDIPDRHMNFFRMHGHFTHPVSGLTCEVILITQTIKDINENIRENIAETYVTVKNTKVGSDKSYIVHIYDRGTTIKSALIRTLPPRFYKPEYFSLYKSHSQHKNGDAAPQEKTPDSRGNIFQGAYFRIGIPLALFLLVPAGFFLYRFFHPVAPVVAVAKDGAAVPVVSPSILIKPVESESWRVVGHYFHNGFYTFIIQNSSGRVRQLVNPPKFQLFGFSSSVELPEGGFATSWAILEKTKGGLLP